MRYLEYERVDLMKCLDEVIGKMRVVKLFVIVYIEMETQGIICRSG